MKRLITQPGKQPWQWTSDLCKINDSLPKPSCAHDGQSCATTTASMPTGEAFCTGSSAEEATSGLSSLFASYSPTQEDRRLLSGLPCNG